MDDQKRAETINFNKMGRSISGSSNACSSSFKLPSPQEINECAMHVPGSAEKFNRQQREPPSPLSSNEVSMTMSVEDIAHRIARQLDGQNENNATFLCLEGMITGGESDSLRRRLLSKKEPYARTRIPKIVKQALKMCGLAVVASIAVPLIAGKKVFTRSGGVLTIVVAGVAGIVSIPVLYGLNKYRRDFRLDREPYPYSFVVEETFKLCQTLATKLAAARFLRKDRGLEFNIGRKLTDEKEARDWDKNGSSSNEAYIQSFSECENVSRDDLFSHFLENISETDSYASPVFLKEETNKDEIRPYVFSERKKPDGINSPTSNPVRGTSNSLAFDEKSAATQDTPVELSSVKEPLKGAKVNIAVRECEDQTDLTTEQQIRAAELQTNDEQSSNLPFSNRVVAHCEVLQDNSCNDEIPASSELELFIVESSTEDEDFSNVEDVESWSETVSKIADGKQAFSDEEEVYGRRDVQSITTRKSTSDTFCCIKEPNDGNNDFVRFSFHDHYEVDTNHNWGILEREKNNDVTTEIQIQIQADEKEETGHQVHGEDEMLCFKEPKKGKRRRKRRNNKRDITDNHQGLTEGAAGDELDKKEQQQVNSNVCEKIKTVQNTTQKAGELQGKPTTPKKRKQTAKVVITRNVDEAIRAADLTEERPRKKKDKTKREPVVKNKAQRNKPKLNIFGLSTRKNAAGSNNPCQEQRTQPRANNKSAGVTSVTKTSSSTQRKHEEDEDKDVVALYDDID